MVLAVMSLINTDFVDFVVLFLSTPDLSAQLTGSIMGSNSSPTGANGCMVVRGGGTAPCTRKSPSERASKNWRYVYELGERI